MKGLAVYTILTISTFVYHHIHIHIHTHTYIVSSYPHTVHNIPPSSLQGTIPFSSSSSSSRLSLPYLPTYLPTYLTYQEFRFPPQNLCRKQVNQVKAGQPGPASHSGHTLLLQSVLPLIETSFPLVPPKLAVRYTYSTRNFILHATYFVRTISPYRTVHSLLVGHSGFDLNQRHFGSALCISPTSLPAFHRTYMPHASSGRAPQLFRKRTACFSCFPFIFFLFLHVRKPHFFAYLKRPQNNQCSSI